MEEQNRSHLTPGGKQQVSGAAGAWTFPDKGEASPCVCLLHRYRKRLPSQKEPRKAAINITPKTLNITK